MWDGWDVDSHCVAYVLWFGRMCTRVSLLCLVVFVVVVVALRKIGGVSRQQQLYCDTQLLSGNLDVVEHTYCLLDYCVSCGVSRE